MYSFFEEIYQKSLEAAILLLECENCYDLELCNGGRCGFKLLKKKLIISILLMV